MQFCCSFTVGARQEERAVALPARAVLGQPVTVTGCRHDDARSFCLLEAEAVSINLAGHERGVLALRLHNHLVCVG